MGNEQRCCHVRGRRHDRERHGSRDAAEAGPTSEQSPATLRRLRQQLKPGGDITDGGSFDLLSLTRRPALSWAAVLIVFAFVSCDGGNRSPTPPIADHDGVGAFQNDPSVSWGVNKTRVWIGEQWSAGSITLCKKSPDDHVILQSVGPVSLAGEVRLDGIGVRTTHFASANRPSDPNTHLVGTTPGIPDGLQDPAGFSVVTTCPTAKAPVDEIVVTLTKTGPKGGALEGLRVDYLDDSELHELVIRFHFGLCGTGDSAVPCADGR
jgi:hypothetical protein